MTQPQDPRKSPLQDDEIALARVLRALPPGEPPAHLDAAILRAATDALSPAPRKPVRGLRWLPTWAIGTAAAAVLAVGVGVQLRPPLAPQYPAASVQEKAPPRPEVRERQDIELVEPEQAAAPPPASAPPEARRTTGRPPPPPPPPAPIAVPSPPPPVVPMPAAPQALPADAAAPAAAEAAQDDAGTLDTIDVTGSRLRSEATDQARRAHQESYARRAQAKAEESARAAQANRSVAGAAMAQSREEAETAPVAAAPPAPDAFSDASPSAPVLPPVADDATLPPAQWFDRIRERRRQGDITGARESLHLFIRTHPDAPLPSDLARLR